jgi:hypothetical protein
LDSVLDIVVGHEKYSFMDGYSGYNQMKMAEKYEEKIWEHMPITLCHLDCAML